MPDNEVAEEILLKDFTVDTALVVAPRISCVFIYIPNTDFKLLLFGK
jgi:hypothetical protein